MKISQKQASILAAEIHKKLTDNSTFVSELKKQQVKQFLDKREKLVEAKERAQEAISAHDGHFKGIVGKYTHKASPYHDYERIIQELENINTPNLDEIEDRIILKAMFANADDMEKFVESIVKEFAKKKVKVQSQN